VKRLPLIVDVKRDSLEDGPGIRSVVFFKGCPLRCLFCHNPETQSPRVEIGFFSRQCIQCDECAKACPVGAVDPGNPGCISRNRCTYCFACVEACPGRALRRLGAPYPVEALAEILLADHLFYRHSGGGVTLSGGECTMFPGYMESLLKLLKACGIHVAIETGGYFRYDVFRRRILPYVDLVLFDLEIADTDLHREITGQSNRVILENFRALVQERKDLVHPRVPLIPGITMEKANLAAIGGFLRECGVQKASVVPYNPLGLDKYETVGRTPPPLSRRIMKGEQVARHRKRLLAAIRGDGRRSRD
jgi:pyruvate formate lyase activating enzyme